MVCVECSLVITEISRCISAHSPTGGGYDYYWPAERAASGDACAAQSVNRPSIVGPERGVVAWVLGAVSR